MTHGLTFDVAHLLAGGLVLVSFLMITQHRLYALLNAFALQALLLHHHQRQARIALRRSREDADEGDRAADPGGADRFVERANAADLDDQVDAGSG